MTTKILPIETAERDLKRVLCQLNLGETITITSSEGQPQALLVSLRSATQDNDTIDWESRWDDLAQQVSNAWQSEKSAVEILSELRR